MGRHVPAVCHQRHGPVERSCRDLDFHHSAGDSDHQPGAPLVALMIVAKKYMFVRAGKAGGGFDYLR